MLRVQLLHAVRCNDRPNNDPACQFRPKELQNFLIRDAAARWRDRRTPLVPSNPAAQEVAS